MNEIKIPDNCPECDSGLVVVHRSGLGNILSDQWRLCRNQECSFQEPVDDFKDRLVCP